MYFRRTVLSGSNPIKSSLSQGDIFSSNFFTFLTFRQENLLVIFLELAEKIESPNYGVKRFKVNFKIFPS